MQYLYGEGVDIFTRLLLYSLQTLPETVAVRPSGSLNHATEDVNKHFHVSLW